MAADIPEAPQEAEELEDTFFTEPLGDKPVTDLLGPANKAFASILENKGFTMAKEMLGVFLMLEKDQEKFKIWLKCTCGATDNLQNLCSFRLAEWCTRHPF